MKIIVPLLLLLYCSHILAQSTTTITYDVSGNRIAKKTQGSSPNPSVTANPQAVSPGQSTTLVASGCTGLVRWSTNQEGPTIVANPTVTTQYSASCIITGCTTGTGKTSVDVIQCTTNEITTSASTTLVQPTQPVLLSAYGCAGGTISWSTGQVGEQVTVNPTATTTYIATCGKPYCPNSGSAAIGITVNCVADNITTTASSPSVPYGQPCTLYANGCTGTVQWSTGQIGTSISVKVYEPATNFVAYCNKPYCTNSSYSVVTVGGTTSCGAGAVLITAQAGDWNTASTWTCNRVPTINDEVYIRHVVTVNGSNNGNINAKVLVLGAGYINSINNGFVNVKSSL